MNLSGSSADSRNFKITSNFNEMLSILLLTKIQNGLAKFFFAVFQRNLRSCWPIFLILLIIQKIRSNQSG
jgi:hypothetical protein